MKKSQIKIPQTLLVKGIERKAISSGSEISKGVFLRNYSQTNSSIVLGALAIINESNN